jgi:hypothetical protein
MKFDWTFPRTSRFDEIWAKSSYSHLDGKSTHEKKFGVSTMSFLIDLNLFNLDFILVVLNLINQWI